jgi:hypothetical protein
MTCITATILSSVHITLCVSCHRVNTAVSYWWLDMKWHAVETYLAASARQTAVTRCLPCGESLRWLDQVCPQCSTCTHTHSWKTCSKHASRENRFGRNKLSCSSCSIHPNAIILNLKNTFSFGVLWQIMQAFLKPHPLHNLHNFWGEKVHPLARKYGKWKS